MRINLLYFAVAVGNGNGRLDQIWASIAPFPALVLLERKRNEKDKEAIRQEAALVGAHLAGFPVRIQRGRMRDDHP
jgi:hypothetical protein